MEFARPSPEPSLLSGNTIPCVPVDFEHKMFTCRPTPADRCRCNEIIGAIPFASRWCLRSIWCKLIVGAHFCRLAERLKAHSWETTHIVQRCLVFSSEPSNEPLMTSLQNNFNRTFTVFSRQRLFSSLRLNSSSFFESEGRLASASLSFFKELKSF